MGSIAEPSVSFPKTKENTVRVYKQRARYEYATIYSILASTFFSTVSFVIPDEDGDPSPFSLPMTAVAGQYDPSNPLADDDGDEETYAKYQESCNDKPFDIYLHGNTAMMLRKMATSSEGTLKVVISSTKVDGVILHFAPNGHSLNYRSAVIHGNASIVTCPLEKHYAMHRLTNHMVRRRWSNVNTVAADSMKSVQVVKVTIRSASAKVRATGIGGLEKAGLSGEREGVWTGVVPVWEHLDADGLVESEYNAGKPVQESVRSWIQLRNEREKKYSEKAAKS